MTDLNLEYSEFEQAASRKRWSIVLSEKYDEGSYITLHEWKDGKHTGRKIFCQVRSCRDIYAAGVRVNAFYQEGQIPMNPPMFWIVEYYPMLSDSKTVLHLKPKDFDSETALADYIYGNTFNVTKESAKAGR